jgi:hypothetical protein
MGNWRRTTWLALIAIGFWLFAFWYVFLSPFYFVGPTDQYNALGRGIAMVGLFLFWSIGFAATMLVIIVVREIGKRRRAPNRQDLRPHGDGTNAGERDAPP